MFHSFFNSLARSTYLSLLLLSFSFTLWSVWRAKSKIQQFLLCWLSLGLVVWPKLTDPFVCQNLKEFCASHFLGRIPGCAPKVKFKLLAQFPVDPLPHSVVSSFIFSLRYSLQNVQTSVSWWASTGVCVTISLLRSQRILNILSALNN